MFILTDQDSVANNFVAELRDIEVQKDSMRFRKNLERLGELLAYEISKVLPYVPQFVNTPLGNCKVNMMNAQPVLAAVLRAALPVFQGFLNIFDKADCAFIGAFRGPQNDDHSFDIQMEYISSSGLENKVLIVIDPMLATGKSMVKSINSLLEFGTPSQVHIVSIIASRDGVKLVQKKFPEAKLWFAAVDEQLSNKSYIVPGLGDAGDLAYGSKL